MITIKLIPNFARLAGRELWEKPYENGKTVKDYINGIGKELGDTRVILSGKDIKDLKIVPDDGDEIIITGYIKDPITAIVSIISSVVTAVYSYAVYFAFHPFIAMAFMATAYSIYSYISGSRLPNTNLGGSGLDEGSPTYGWEGAQITQDVGVPVGIVYGEHRIAGNIINQHIWTDGDKNYLNILLALCEGEIEEISSIKINDNPIANFDGIEQYTRMGTNSQSVIANFEDLHNLYSVGSTLSKDDPYTYTTVDSDVEAFELKLFFPSGLYYQNSGNGSINTWEVTYKVEYKLHSAGTWTDLGETTVNAKSRTSLRRVFRKDGLTAGQYDIRITKTSDDSDFYHVGDLQLTEIDEIKTDDLSYPNTALLGLRLLATEQLSGTVPNITSIVKGRKVSVPDIRNAGNAVDWEDYYWDPNTEQWKLLSDDTVLSWDGETCVDAYSANPVWCIKDLLLSGRYGLGEFITTANIDSAQMLEMAKYCDEKVPDGDGSFEKRFRLDVVIDSNTKAIDALLQLCAVFNAMPIYSAGTLGLVIDKETTPTQLFGMGNIIKDSFSQSWKSIKEVPNVVEVQFMDKDKDYKMETVAYIDEDALADGDPIRKKQVRLFTTKTSYAIRAGRYALKIAKYINRSVSFKAGIDAIACQAGDVISVSHDVPQWGFSGRTQDSSTTTLVKLDRSVTIESGKTYKIQVRFADDTIEEKTVSNVPGSYTEVNVSSAFSQAPQEYDVYAFGESTKIKKDFRVLSIQKDGKGEVSISATEYNENAYDDTDIILPQNNYSALSSEIPDVTNLALTEDLVKMQDGTIQDTIDVWFDKPQMEDYHMRQYVKAKIYLSDDDGETWTPRGETTGIHFRIIGDIVDLVTYKIAVVSVDENGQENAITNSPQATITVIGKSAPPSNVSGFSVIQDGDEIVFSWAPISDVDVWGYEIREGDSWDRGTVIDTAIQQTTYRLPIFQYGDRRYMIKAIDTSGNYSNIESYKQFEITGAITIENVLNSDLDTWSEGILERSSGNQDNVVNSGDAQVQDSSTNDVIQGNLEGFEIDTVAEDEDVVNSSGLAVVNSTNAQIIADKTETDFLQLRQFDSGYASEAIYTSKVIDLSAKLPARIMVTINVEGIACSYDIYVRTSDDNTTWSSWDLWAPGEYSCRYYQIKIVLTNTDTTEIARVWNLKGKVTVRLTEDSDEDVSVVNSQAISFNKTFLSKVNVQCIAQGTNYARITAKSLTGFTVEVRDDATGNLTTANVDWVAKGY